MKQEEQQFLNNLDKKLWTAADKLRSNLDAAVYKHAVLDEHDEYWKPSLLPGCEGYGWN